MLINMSWSKMLGSEINEKLSWHKLISSFAHIFELFTDTFYSHQASYILKVKENKMNRSPTLLKPWVTHSTYLVRHCCSATMLTSTEFTGKNYFYCWITLAYWEIVLETTKTLYVLCWSYFKHMALVCDIMSYCKLKLFDDDMLF